MKSRQKELLELLDGSGPALHALLTRLTLRRDVAEELMQELFIKLNNMQNGEAIENWDAYARQAAINLAFDWRRKRKPPALVLEQIPEPACSDDSPLGSLVRAEELEATLNAIGRLREAARRAIVMRYIEQQSYEHIADQLGKTPHHVRALCSKALARLRDVLTPGRSLPSDKEPCNVESR